MTVSAGVADLALEHGHAKNQCRNGVVMRQLPPAIQDFARHFVDMQRLRHYADYAPVTNLDRSQVLHLVDETERTLPNSTTRRPATAALSPFTRFSGCGGIER